MIVISDFKYALRLLTKKPGFTALTTLVMATGVSLSIFLFSFMNTMIFKPLPFQNGDTLVEISSSQNGSRSNGPINLHDYQEIRNNVKGLGEFSAYNLVRLNVSGQDGARRYKAAAAEPNIFAITRSEPAVGRGFKESENHQGAEKVAVIGFDMWQNLFGGDPQIIDQNLRINRESYRIIGVMPKGFSFPSSAELWIPLQQSANSISREEAANIYGLAHIQPGASREEINHQLALIMQRIAERHPETNNGISAYADTMQMAMVGDAISVVYAMHIVAILILLLAAINAGNLLFSRAVERGKETAIRVALGAPRARLISQMLWESIIICVLGGIIGLFILAWGLEVTESVTATFFVGNPMFWMDFGIDTYTLILFFVFLFATILITGLLPAWKNSDGDFNALLRDGTRGALGKKSGHLNSILVISEIFISALVLIVAGVVIIGAYKASHADYGAKTDNVITAEIVLDEAGYRESEEKVKFIKALESRLESNHGITDVAIASSLPGEFATQRAMAIEGREYTNDSEGSYPRENYIVVTPESLGKLGIELRQGRYFASNDDKPGTNTVIVTQSFADRHFTNEDPLGKRLRIVESDDTQPTWLTIVGIVEHTIQGVPNEPSGKVPSIFRPFSQDPLSDLSLALETTSSYTSAVKVLRETLSSIDPELPAFKIEPYEQNLSRNIAPLRFISKVFLLFGIVAAILAASGVYGVMSNTIIQRTQEIGIKRALGAMEERITCEFLISGIRQLLWGAIPGLLLGSAMGFVISKHMGTDSSDILSIAIGLLIIIGTVVLLATYIPTQRAIRMKPSEALRYE